MSIWNCIEAVVADVVVFYYLDKKIHSSCVLGKDCNLVNKVLV